MSSKLSSVYVISSCTTSALPLMQATCMAFSPEPVRCRGGGKGGWGVEKRGVIYEVKREEGEGRREGG